MFLRNIVINKNILARQDLRSHLNTNSTHVLSQRLILYYKYYG